MCVCCGVEGGGEIRVLDGEVEGKLRKDGNFLWNFGGKRVSSSLLVH